MKKKRFINNFHKIVIPLNHHNLLLNSLWPLITSSVLPNIRIQPERGRSRWMWDLHADHKAISDDWFQRPAGTWSSLFLKRLVVLVLGAICQPWNLEEASSVVYTEGECWAAKDALTDLKHQKVTHLNECFSKPWCWTGQLKEQNLARFILSIRNITPFQHLKRRLPPRKAGCRALLAKSLNAKGLLSSGLNDPAWQWWGQPQDEGVQPEPLAAR